jgi:hypothetical protein
MSKKKIPKPSKEAREYLSSIGSIGGKKSRRTMSTEEAQRIAGLRWKKKEGADV